MKSSPFFATLALLTLFATPALALDIKVPAKATTTATSSASAPLDAKTQARITKAKDRANKEIDRRISSLTALKTRILAMVKISERQKSDLSGSIDTQISALTTLKAKIDADTELSALKTDVQSITSSYRIYALMIPQGHIIATADKLMFVADNAAAIADKLSARIDAAAALGKNVTDLKTKLDDMKVKITDAKTQANAAVTLVASLSPDNGDSDKKKANQDALKEGRSKIQAGMKSMDGARKTGHDIAKLLVDMHLESATSTTNTATTTQ